MIVFIADPPWLYQNWSDTSRGAYAAHHKGMQYEDMASLRPLVDGVAQDEPACLLMWGTWPKGDQAHDLLRAWGFTHKTGFPWIKTSPNTGRIRRGVGFWAMSTSEFVIVGVRGDFKRTKVDPNVMGLLCGSERQFFDRIQGHSRKPYGLYEWVEEFAPTARKVELFATEDREGWECYGHRTGWHLTPDGFVSVEEAKMRGLLPKDYDPFAQPVRKKDLTSEARRRASYQTQLFTKETKQR